MDSNSDSQPLRNQKTFEEDMISHLPDAIICRILSFVPTEYSIRTSVLSKRWENLWALSPKINLELLPRGIFEGNIWSEEEYQRFGELCANTFPHSVDNLFFIRGSSGIEVFKLCFMGRPCSFGPRLSSWIRATIMCNVRELDLNINSSYGELGELPLCIFTSKALEILKLNGGFILNVPHYVHIPNLKTLCLDTVTYSSDASIQKLLDGCPILQDLQIKRHEWDGILILDMRICSLKKLKLHCNMNNYSLNDRQYKIVVDAPNLEFIDIYDTCLDDILFKDMPNIVEARFYICNGEDDEDIDKAVLLSKVLQTIINVRRLYLSADTLNLFCLNVELALPTFRNLVQLDLCCPMAYGVRELYDFLWSSPKLESLYLTGGDYIPSVFLMVPRQPVPPECLLYTLKTIQVQEFDGEYSILAYLLENCMVLEKMIIFTRHSPIELQDFLTTYPRFSTSSRLDGVYSCFTISPFRFS